MKKIKKVLKIILLSSFIISIITLCGGVIFYHSVTHGITLNTQKLTESQQANSLTILDCNGNAITQPKKSYIKLSKLSTNTKNAFIFAEDKRFYSHNGIDLIRIAKATLSNIKTLSFSQGASTISQQLIKNTQLSNEKTITRKLKELKLTNILEKKYSKDEILEFYLNNIYFGNGCYGIESASQHYFSKSASNLTLAESAALASTINAPSFYDLEDKPENAKKRRDLILKILQNNNKISEIEYKNATNEDISLNLQSLSNNTFLFDEITKEACKILNITPNNLLSSHIKIFTDIDLNLTNNTKNIINKNYTNLESNPKIATLIIDNKTNQIISITGNKNIFSTKIQPGSTIKPILVYAPAIEENKITPSTKILDEPINFAGYQPTNSNGIYHGCVSVRESVKNSYNIPAVKILNEFGIKKAQNFAEKLGIEFHKNDNNLAIALGGFTEGITLKSLADAYKSFANNGIYSKSTFITKITKNNKIIYENKPQKTQVMKDSTAYLITNMLIDTSKTGTAKRLKDFTFEIASKTGTVGCNNSKQNRESFNISYTTDHTILTYFGGTEMPENINGSTYPTMLTKDIFSSLYKNSSPQNFSIPNSVISASLNKVEYEKNNLIIDKNPGNNFIDYFSKDNIPSNLIEPNFEIEAFNFKNKKPIIQFETTSNYTYQIIRKQNKKEEIISSSTDNKLILFEDNSAKSNEIYEYFVMFCDFSNNKIIESNHITLKVF